MIGADLAVACADAVEGGPRAIDVGARIPVKAATVAGWSAFENNPKDAIPYIAENQVVVLTPHSKPRSSLADVEELRTLGVTVRDITGPMALIRRYPSSRSSSAAWRRSAGPSNSAMMPWISGAAGADGHRVCFVAWRPPPVSGASFWTARQPSCGFPRWWWD